MAKFDIINDGIRGLNGVDILMTDGKEELEKLKKEYYEQEDVKKYVNAENESSLNAITTMLYVWLAFVACGITFLGMPIFLILVISSTIIVIATAIWSFILFSKMKRNKTKAE